MSDSGWGYMALIPIIIIQKIGLGGTALALAVFGAAAFGGGVMYEKHQHNDDAAKTVLSEGRAQLLKENLAGSRADFDQFLDAQTKQHEGDFKRVITDAVNQYFAGKGLPCDPGPAANTIGETLQKARVPCLQPAAR